MLLALIYPFLGMFLVIITKNRDIHLIVYGITGLIIIFVSIRANPDILGEVNAIFLASIVLVAISIISIALPEKIAGRWTPYGQEYYSKWHGFMRYVKDYSLMKECSPESIEIWNKYLVYATALGVADGVRKAMRLSIPNDQLEGNDLYSFHYINDPGSLFRNAMDIALGRN